MNEKLANEIIGDLSEIWNKYCDAFEEPIYGSYVLWYINKVQKLIWDEVTAQKCKPLPDARD
jgi:hypothetical protein